MKTEDNQEYSKEKKITSILLEIVKIGNESIEKLNNQAFKDAWNLMLADLLVRFNLGITSSTYLLNEFRNSNTGRYSIMTILRSATLDFLILSYLFTFYFKAMKSKSKQDEKIFNNQIFSFIGDQLKHQIKHLKLLFEHKKINRKEYLSILRNLALRYPEFLSINITVDDPFKSLKYKKKPPSAEKIFKHLHSNKMTREESQMYLHYDTFSKVEHYGIYSRGLIQDDTIMPVILQTLKFIILSHYRCHKFIDPQFGLQDNSILINNLGKEFGELMKDI
ncbi:MAG: hypothetical protein KDB74_08305 [Flavobacteriales bacterium]|nr:hypothetical protein [Flavobacteriales bacterium]